MSKDIYFNSTLLTPAPQGDVFFNGVAMNNVYLNGTHVWQKHAMTPGTQLITFGWGYNADLVSSLAPYWNTYGTVMFKQQPYTHSGSAGSDHRVQINLQPGFNFHYYHQQQHGTHAAGQGLWGIYTGQSSVLYSGGSVTGATGFYIAASGNGGSSIKIGYWVT